MRVVPRRNVSSSKASRRPSPTRSTFSNGMCGLPGTSNASPGSPRTKPDASSALRRPASRQSRRPAKPRMGRSSCQNEATATSTLASSS